MKRKHIVILKLQECVLMKQTWARGYKDDFCTCLKDVCMSEQNGLNLHCLNSCMLPDAKQKMLQNGK